jgi:hypothetical protein
MVVVYDSIALDGRSMIVVHDIEVHVIMRWVK